MEKRDLVWTEAHIPLHGYVYLFKLYGSSSIALAKIDPRAPFDKACYIGCGVTTGIGAVLFTSNAEAGCTAAFLYLGGIGLNVIQGLSMIGASKII